jgi:hypothetical protein
MNSHFNSLTTLYIPTVSSIVYFQVLISLSQTHAHEVTGF